MRWTAKMLAPLKRRQARQAADVFARICCEGAAEELYDAHRLLHKCMAPGTAWRLAMAKVARLPCVDEEIQRAFIPIWTESRALPRLVRHRPIMAAALRVLMPGYSGRPLTLYRGADVSEYRRRSYGFSWTPEIDIAQFFAEHEAQLIPGRKDGTTFQSVVLKTLAPSKAVLLFRPVECPDDEFFDESEVVVDPFRLGKVEIVERIPVTVDHLCCRWIELSLYGTPEAAAAAFQKAVRALLRKRRVLGNPKRRQ